MMDKKEITEDLSWIVFLSKIIIEKYKDGSITQNDMERFEESVNNIISKHEFKWKKYKLKDGVKNE